MSECTRSQVIILLEKIAEEMKDPHDRKIVLQYARRIKKVAWSELMRELF